LDLDDDDKTKKQELHKNEDDGKDKDTGWSNEFRTSARSFMKS
jgi:hypothetical protein